MKGGSLCTGGGGLDLGLTLALDIEWAWHCEPDAACAAVLDHHYPGVTNHADARLVYPREKKCVVCGTEFVPHPTKRARQQTCGDPDCKSALLRLRWQERRAA